MSSAAYKWFWEKMNALTEVRSLSPGERQKFDDVQAAKRLSRLQQNLDTLNEFLADAQDAAEVLDKSGAEVSYARHLIDSIKGPINVLANVVGMTQEAVDAAEQVSRELAAWYNKAERAARAAAGNDDDLYYVLSAAITRQWQARNVKAVLGTQTDSFVMRLWPKWRDRIFDLVF